LFSCDEDDDTGGTDGGEIVISECEEFTNSSWELTSSYVNYNGYGNSSNCPTGATTTSQDYPIYYNFESNGAYSSSGSGTSYAGTISETYMTYNATGTWSCNEDVLSLDYSASGTITIASTGTVTPYTTNFSGTSTTSVDGSSATLTSVQTTSGCTYQSISYYTVSN